LGYLYEQILALESFGEASDGPVYLSGSAITPFANPWSDIDVYAITDRGPLGGIAVHEGATQSSQHYLADRRVDFEFWRPADVSVLAERLGQLELGTGDYIVGTLFTYNEVCFMHRLRVGLPILNAGDFEASRACFDFDKLAGYLSQEAIRATDGFHEDVCGMLEGGDLDSAVLTARRLVALAVDAYVHKRGSTDPTEKWRPRLLVALDDGSAFHGEVVQTYWRLEFPGDMGPGAVQDVRRRYAESCIAFSRQVTSWIQA
jgi:hypothetical protein